MGLHKVISGKTTESLKGTRKPSKYKVERVVQTSTTNGKHIKHLRTQPSSSSACSEPFSYSVVDPIQYQSEHQAKFPPVNLHHLPSWDKNDPDSYICRLRNDNTLIISSLDY